MVRVVAFGVEWGGIGLKRGGLLYHISSILFLSLTLSRRNFLNKNLHKKMVNKIPFLNYLIQITLDVNDSFLFVLVAGIFVLSIPGSFSVE